MKAKTRAPASPAQSRRALPAISTASDFQLPVSCTRPQITMDGDSELNRPRAFARQVHAIHFKKHLRSFQRIDEAHQLQVVAGKAALDLNRHYARSFRFLLLVSRLLNVYP